MSACSAIVLPAVSGWAACFPCLRLPPPLTGFPVPYPPDPLPLWGRGRFIVILCKGLRPLHPRGLNPGGTGGMGRTTRSVGDVLSLSPVATAFRRKVLGGLGDSFKSPPAFSPLPLMRWRLLRVAFSLEPAQTPSQQQIYSRKVLGGLGDSFKSPPAFPPAYSQGLFLENILLF